MRLLVDKKCNRSKVCHLNLAHRRTDWRRLYDDIQAVPRLRHFQCPAVWLCWLFYRSGQNLGCAFVHRATAYLRQTDRAWIGRQHKQ